MHCEVFQGALLPSQQLPSWWPYLPDKGHHVRHVKKEKLELYM